VSNLTTPASSHNHHFNNTSSPKYGNSTNVSRPPPIVTGDGNPNPLGDSSSSSSSSSRQGWVVHGHGRYEEASTPYIGGASRPPPSPSASTGRYRSDSQSTGSGGGGSSAIDGAATHRYSPSARRQQQQQLEEINSFEKDRDRIEVQWQNIEVRTHKLMRDRYVPPSGGNYNPQYPHPGGNENPSLSSPFPISHHRP
jgi:hypothetical protein